MRVDELPGPPSRGPQWGGREWRQRRKEDYSYSLLSQCMSRLCVGFAGAEFRCDLIKGQVGWKPTAPVAVDRGSGHLHYKSLVLGQVLANYDGVVFW